MISPAALKVPTDSHSAMAAAEVQILQEGHREQALTEIGT
jgi:hypothetical protein